jgi:hypothetical protein
MQRKTLKNLKTKKKQNASLTIGDLSNVNLVTFQRHDCTKM